MTIKIYSSNKIYSLDEFRFELKEEADILAPYWEKFDIEFLLEGQKLGLKNSVGKELFIDVKKDYEYHQRFFCKHSIYDNPLARALGHKKGRNVESVVDATAGQLGDSLLMCAMGMKVVAYERHPIAQVLIANALRLFNPGIEFFAADFSAIATSDKAEVILFDPMYSEHQGKAMPKKEMQVFRDIIGADEDSNQVAELIKEKCKRLVIKRSLHAPSLLKDPSHQIKGKSTRYDVYL